MRRSSYQRMRTPLLVLTLGGGLVMGCSKSNEMQSATPPAGMPGGGPSAASGGPGGPGAPPGTPGAMPGSGANSEERTRAALEAGAAAYPNQAKKVADLEAKYGKSASDEATKKELVAATYDYGHTLMTSDKLEPRQKYRAALKQFRRVVELDPEHAKANAELKQIEDIYRQMGRPVPE